MSRARWEIPTPGLLLDLDQFDRNIERLRSHLAETAANLKLRPHMKTLKSVKLGHRLTKALGTDAITVSTLAEAEVYAGAGYRDILYAVGISPAKLDRVAALIRAGIDCQVITDNQDVSRAIARFSKDSGIAIPVLIEIDCDGHRAGIRSDEHEKLIAVASELNGSADLRGVMTHGGGSYGASSKGELHAAAEQEVRSVRIAARILREAGFQAPVISVGSTPTALAHVNRTGVSELRAGVFPFFDLVMAGIGVCDVSEIALSVVTSVIGHQRQKGWILCDAGWMALSRDRGTQSQAQDCGYGLVCDVEGRAIPNLIVASTNQEHGILAMREGSDTAMADIPIGTQLRILPNHACATAAQHGGYNVTSKRSRRIQWFERFSGW
ncbi:MAG: alanine racemase [Pseudomonadota bacterium]